MVLDLRMMFSWIWNHSLSLLHLHNKQQPRNHGNGHKFSQLSENI